MPKFRRRTMRIAALAMLLTVAIGVSVVTVTPALAASCYGSSCNHLDPQTNGCSTDAYTLQTVYPYGQDGPYFVELRYSPACSAAWARLTAGITGGLSYHYLRLNVWCCPAGGNPLWTETKYIDEVIGGNNYWTAMASFNYWVEACNTTSAGPEAGFCTGRD